MAEQSQKEEMNAAIRAHRERQNVPRSIAPEPLSPLVMPEPEPPKAAVFGPGVGGSADDTSSPEPEKPKSLLARLFDK